jgi:hypothetical protein
MCLAIVPKVYRTEGAPAMNARPLYAEPSHLACINITTTWCCIQKLPIISVFDLRCTAQRGHPL